MKLADYVYTYRKARGLSMRAFGNLCGLSCAYISILEKGINPTTKKAFTPTLETLGKIASATNNSLEELLKILDGDEEILLNHKEETVIPCSKAVKIPILGHIIAGVPFEATEAILGYEEIAPKMASTGNFFALKVKGNSMEPRICEGDTLIVKQQAQVNSGDLAVVLVNGSEATVKRVKLHEHGLTLIATNTSVYEPHFYTEEDIKKLPVQIIGKVVEVRFQI